MRCRNATWCGPLLVSLGCTVPAVDLDGRPCPCVDGWICDAVSQTCERDDEEGSTGVIGTGRTSDGDSSSGTAPSLEVVELSADWSTPRSIHWRWEVDGDEASFHAYEIWIATAAEDLEDASTATVFDGTVNPELDRFSLVNTMDVDFVRGTITDGLEPNTEYFARLRVLDTAGGSSLSPNVAVRSTAAPPNDELVVFSDADPVPPGDTLPACMERTDTAPLLGTHHYELTVRCSEGGVSICTDDPAAAVECYENLRVQGLDLPVPNIGGGDFADAFLEVSVAVDPPDDNLAHGWWSDFSVQAGEQWTGLRGVTIRADGAYRLYQIPLTQLGLDVDTFTGVQGFRVGSMWRHAARVRFDEIRLRW